MAFSKKTWKDRISQYINRRLLTDSDGNTQQVTVTRDEGSVTEAGDAFSASNMNDLEDRIEDAFDGLTAADIPYSAGVSVADMLNITDITSSYCTLSTGYSLDANSRVYKQSRHIWGNLLIVASTALPGANDSVNIGTINSAYRTESPINGFCGLSNGQWFTNEIGYAYIAVNGSVTVAAPSTGKTYIKMMIDYCTA